MYPNTSPNAYRTYFPLTFNYVIGGIISRCWGYDSTTLVKGGIMTDSFSWRLYNFDTSGITGYNVASNNGGAKCIAIGY
jgi:hypothetical protein